MKDFFKVFGKGILVTLLSPFIVLLLALYTVYLTIVYLIMLVRNIIIFFMGGNTSVLKADKQAKLLLENKANIQQDMTTVLTDLMHSAIQQNPEAVQAMAQQQIVSNKIAEQRAIELAEKQNASATTIFGEGDNND